MMMMMMNVCFYTTDPRVRVARKNSSTTASYHNKSEHYTNTLHTNTLDSLSIECR